MGTIPQLHVAMYHYLRDLPRTRFPQIKGMMLDDFSRQVTSLPEEFEMATLESALAYLNGEYTPKRDMCLMTFDDGLREHFADVTPILAERGIQGLFFVITSCLEEGVVASVHMNHFLTAQLGFVRYSALFIEALRESGEAKETDAQAHTKAAQRTYPLDQHDVAEFKYLFNFLLPADVRDRIVTQLFEEHLGSQREFAAELYMSWSEARKMQEAGMAIGGHTHRHRPLASLTGKEMAEDLGLCRSLMNANLKEQDQVPFCYPYGKSDSFTPATVKILQDLGFACSFATEKNTNFPGIDVFAINRLDGQHHRTLNRWKDSRSEQPARVRLSA